MKWYENLYVGESIADKAGRIKRKIEHNGITPSVYLVTLPSNPANLLDIIPARDLLQPGYPKQDLHIIGLAKGYDEAIGLVQQMIEEALQKTGTTDIVSYLKNERRREA